MSERIWDGLRKNALYKSTYTLLYFVWVSACETSGQDLYDVRSHGKHHAWDVVYLPEARFTEKSEEKS